VPCSPFPVDPADVPDALVRAVRRTALRRPETVALWNEDTARLFCAVMIAALAVDGGEQQTDGHELITL
jgi:hypothetical protein